MFWAAGTDNKHYLIPYPGSQSFTMQRNTKTRIISPTQYFVRCRHSSIELTLFYLKQPLEPLTVRRSGFKVEAAGNNDHALFAAALLP